MLLLYEELTYKVRGALFKVYNTLGYGHKELVYSKALSRELENQKVNFEREVNIAVYYEDEVVGHYRPDFVIDKKVIIELKAVEIMPKSFENQVIHYLKSTNFKVGLIVNFGAPKLYIKRLVWSGDYLRKSAINQRESLK